jgi:alpha-galactosidase
MYGSALISAEQSGIVIDDIIRIDVDGDGVARITGLTAWEVTADAALPLLDVIVTGEGRAWSGGRYCESEAGRRLRYQGHDKKASELRVDLADPVTGLRAEVFYRVLVGVGALRCWARVTNDGGDPVTIESVTSFVCGILDQPDDLDIHWAENDWLAEGRWQSRWLRDALPNVDWRAHGAHPRGRFGLTSTGTWSTGQYPPMGSLVSRRTGHAWAWQIEHNGGWHWQVGEHAGTYIALLGPTDAEHGWRVTLAPGEYFVTVPVTVVVSTDGFEGAIAALTRARRTTRRPHADHERLPVIFNDYMNTLMGDPTVGRLLPLITAAGRAGAEYFCIDAGWYADLDNNWWHAVGAWRPSGSRFPNGIAEILDHIRAAGMIPGLWLEPEVVGVTSPVARELPDDAFFRRDGHRVADHGRYQLDLRHSAAVKHLDDTVDFLVGALGVGYLKLDYNISPCSGTDTDTGTDIGTSTSTGTDTGGGSPGAGLLAANRAHLAWLDGVRDRYPDLVIENCASGGMRADYALLSRLQLQSTSDQRDYLRYPAIAAAAPAAIAPEQAASWAYPQPSFTDDEIAFTLCTAMLGRVHLSGHLDRMSHDQHALVSDAVSVYKTIRADIGAAVPFWPLGLPRWTDSWIALGLRAPGASYLTVWHRGPPGPTDVVTLAVPDVRGASVLYPLASGAKVSLDTAAGYLSVALPRVPSACVLRLTLPKKLGSSTPRVCAPVRIVTCTRCGSSGSAPSSSDSPGRRTR